MKAIFACACALLVSCMIVSSSARAGEPSCECRDADGKPLSDSGLQKPAPSFKELQKATERLRALDKMRHEILDYPALRSPALKNQHFLECFRDCQK